MDQDEQETRRAARHLQRQRLKIVGQLMQFQVAMLYDYYPGQEFWSFVLPGGGAKDFPAQAWESGYANAVPKELGTPVDRVLVDWLSGQISGEQAAQQLAAPIDAIARFRAEHPASEETQILAGFLLDSLRELQVEGLSDENRQAMLKLIQHFRSELSTDKLPPDSGHSPSGGHSR